MKKGVCWWVRGLVNGVWIAEKSQFLLKQPAAFSRHLPRLLRACSWTLSEETGLHSTEDDGWECALQLSVILLNWYSGHLCNISCQWRQMMMLKTNCSLHGEPPAKLTRELCLEQTSAGSQQESYRSQYPLYLLPMQVLANWWSGRIQTGVCYQLVFIGPPSCVLVVLEMLGVFKEVSSTGSGCLVSDRFSCQKNCMV